MNNSRRILLICPSMGMSGALVRHMPLSLLYAAVDALRAGFAIDIADIRLNPSGWREDIAALLSDDTILAGITVMTGTPVGNALEVSRWLRQNNPGLPVVWGGPHVTFCGADVLTEPSVDYAVSSFGSLPLRHLAGYLRRDDDALPPARIKGLHYRDPSTGSIFSNPPEAEFELPDFRDIPYHLIAHNLSRYGQLETPDIIFPLYSSMGCPYHCAFCSSPAHYRAMARKYLCIPPDDVVDHIEYVHRTYGASYVYFIDDDSFVDPAHVAAIIDGIARRGVDVRLGFRGARVDEVLRMDDSLLSRLVDAGTTILHIGAESGSQRMLDLMQKDFSVADIVEANRRLAGHPEITVAYNWIVGLPGETLDDLRQTRGLIMRLLADNPAAIIFAPNLYRPLPGTVLYESAVQHGYCRPERLEEWIDVEVEGAYRPPWLSRAFMRMVEMMRVTSYFIDDKPKKLQTGNTLRFRFLRFAGLLYSPIARLRFKYGFAGLLAEQYLFSLLVNRLRGRS